MSHLSTTFLWILKDGEVILETQKGPVFQRKSCNLQVSLMTSCIWFGSCPNGKGGDGKLVYVVTVYGHTSYLWVLLFIIQTKTYL